MDESSSSEAFLLQIDHVNLVECDMKAMIAFYRDVLGMTLTPEATITGPWIDDVTGLKDVTADVAFLEAEADRRSNCSISIGRKHNDRWTGPRQRAGPAAHRFSRDGHRPHRRAAPRRRRAAAEQNPRSANHAQVALAQTQKRLVYFHDPEGNLLELCVCVT